jgi:hypothetical protein
LDPWLRGSVSLTRAIAGLVDTDMAKGMPGAIPIAESAAGFIAVIDELDPSKIKEGILSYDGSIVAWWMNCHWPCSHRAT